jgi:hypothetical protein
MRVSMMVVAFVLASAFARQAGACSCVVRDAARALEPNEVLFEATVEAIEVVQPPPPPGYQLSPNAMYVGGRTHLVRLKDVKAVQGTPQAAVSTSAVESACGYRFQIGQRYRIHAYNSDGQLSVSYCGMTRPISDKPQPVKIGG